MFYLLDYLKQKLLMNYENSDIIDQKRNNST